MVEHTLVNIEADDDSLNDESDVASWSAETVKIWLRQNGSIDLQNNEITGDILLTLSHEDLERSPFNIADQNEREHLHLCIEMLKKVQIAKYMKKLERNGIRNGFHNGVVQPLNNSSQTNGHIYDDQLSHSNSSSPLLSVFRRILPDLVKRLPEIFEEDGDKSSYYKAMKIPYKLSIALCKCLCPCLRFTRNCYGYSARTYDEQQFNKYTATKHLLLHVKSEDQSENGSCSRIEQFPSEKLKSFLAVLYLLLGFVVSVLILQLVHERVPDKSEDPPLPDIFFDVIPKRVEWAFDVCEAAGMVLVFIMVIMAVFHRHRLIILRRVCFIMGTLYLYRCCTMFVTTLPVPGMHFNCAKKTHYKISLMLARAAELLYGGGLTVTGSHHLCGDYLFSGHTIVLVISYLTIKEYSSKRLWWLHWFSWLLSAVGILCILFAHDHYTVDVVVAYLLTTRLFWTYHTMCNTNGFHTSQTDLVTYCEQAKRCVELFKNTM